MILQMYPRYLFLGMFLLPIVNKYYFNYFQNYNNIFFKNKIYLSFVDFQIIGTSLCFLWPI